jgi:hypothetical protein
MRIAGPLMMAAFIVSGLRVAAPQLLLAHHSYSIYDSTKPISLTGKIVGVSYQNPHVNVQVDTGERVWRLDMPGPRRLRSRGLTPEVLQVGRTLEVLGWPHRNGSADFAPVQMTVEGRTFEIRRQGR